MKYLSNFPGNRDPSQNTSKEELYSGGVDSSSLRCCLRQSALEEWHIGSTDVSTAFLNAGLNLPYMIIVWAPNIFSRVGVCQQNEAWIVKKAIYGLKESPRAWGDHRDHILKHARLYDNQMTYRLKQTKCDPSVWTITPRPVEMLFYSCLLYTSPSPRDS